LTGQDLRSKVKKGNPTKMSKSIDYELIATVCDDRTAALGHSEALVGGSVAAAVVAMALALVIFICVRRQWSHSVERRLRLRAQLSGLATDDDEQV